MRKKAAWRVLSPNDVLRSCPRRYCHDAYNAASVKGRHEASDTRQHRAAAPRRSINEKGTPPGVPFCCLKLYCLKKVEYLTRIAVTECNSGNDRNIVTDLHAGQDLMHSCTLYTCSDGNAVVLGAGKGYSSFFGLNIRKAAGRKLIRGIRTASSSALNRDSFFMSLSSVFSLF